MPPSPTRLALAALLATAAVARAEPPPAAGWVGAPVLPAGQAEVGLVHEVLLARAPSLDTGLWERWSDGLDLAIAVTPRLTLGVSHSARAQGTVDQGAAGVTTSGSGAAGQGTPVGWSMHAGARTPGVAAA